MSTGSTWAEFFPQRVLDLAVLDLGLASPARAALRETWTDLWGVGGVFTSYATFTDTAGRLALDAGRVAWTGDGRRLVLDNLAAKGFAQVPYEANPATTYHLAARYAEKPQGAILGFEGTPGFTFWEEAIGEVLTPSSVVSTGGGSTLRVHVAGTLGASMKWTNAAWSRPATVWKVDPVTGTADAVYAGALATDGAGLFFVDVPHTFGQGTTPSTTAADYRVLVEGLTIGGAGLASDLAYVYLGTVLAGVHATTGQHRLVAVGSWIAAYDVEHDPTTGKHTAINPTAIAGRGGTGNDLEITADQLSIVADVAGSAIAQVLARAAGSKARLYQANAGTSKVEVDRDTGAIVVEASTGSVRLDAVTGTTTLAGATLKSEDRHDLDAGATAAFNGSSLRAYAYQGDPEFTWALPLTGWTPDDGIARLDNLRWDSAGSRGLLFTNDNGAAPVTFTAARDLTFAEAPPTGPAAVYELERVWFDVIWGAAGTFELRLHEIGRSTGSVIRSSTSGALSAAGVYDSAGNLAGFGSDLSWTMDPSLYRYVVEIKVTGVTNGLTGINLRGGWVEYKKRAAL